jgi:MFS family permease
VFCIIESRVAEPMFRLALFRIRAFTAGNAASLLGAIARGGLQFMLIFWLQAIWLPLHGYAFADTPLWAGIYMLPLTAGFLIAGPISGVLSDRYGPRLFATGGLLVAAAAFTGLMLLPVNFPYWLFGTIIFFNGVGSGLFAAPNTAAIMSSVPADQRGSASGMRSTFQNSGMSLSIGIFFSLMIAGLASALPVTLDRGLRGQGVPAAAAAHAAHLPPVSTLFSALLGFNPIRNLLRISGVLSKLPARNAAVLTSRQYFPHLISGPFHHGLIVVFSAAIAMSVAGALISVLRGRQFFYADPAAVTPAAAGATAINGVAAVNGAPASGNGHGRAPNGTVTSGLPDGTGTRPADAQPADAQPTDAQPAGAGGGAGPARRPAVRAPRPDDTKM